MNWKDGLANMYVARKIFVCILTAIVMMFCLMNTFKETITRDDDFVVIPEYDGVYYEYLSYNTASTQREALCNIIYNLEKEGFTQESLDYSDSGIDCIMKNEKTDEVWRYYFDSQLSYIIFFNSDYENSFEGQTYINERR